MLHPTLERQLKKLEMTVKDLPECPERWQHFLERISRAYTDSDEDRYLLERSLTISSREMQELYETIRRSSESRVARERDKLRASEERYRKLVQTAPEVILSLSVDGTIWSLNQAFERLTGLSCDKWLGRPLASLIHSQDLAHLDERVRQVLEGVTTSAFELRILTASGDYLDAELTMTQLVESGEISGLLGIARDVTDRKRVQQALSTAKDAAEAASMAKSDFLANMSHEIRTPLNAIIGFTSLVLDGPLEPKVQHFVERIRSSGDTLLALINDILDFSKIESGKMELEEQPFELRDLLASSLELVAAEAEEKGLKLVSSLAAGCAEVVIGDVTRVRQILVNLLSNAVKFTHQGEVRVTARCQEAEEGLMTLELEVSDTGIGIARDKMEAIFQSFSQADASTSRKYGGTGLGLAISQRLVELMGGSMCAESEPGRGSTFHCTVMVRPADDMAPATEGRPMATEIDRDLGGRMPLRILVVEDNVVNQKVALMLLQRMGYRADLAADGLEAIDCLERQRYDLVLMDIQMPHLGGLGATRRIRQRWSGAERPWIVAITAAAQTDDRQRCLAAGMDDFVSKPIRAEDLHGAIVRCADARGIEAMPAGHRRVENPELAPEESPGQGAVGPAAGFEELAPMTDLKMFGPRLLQEVFERFVDVAERHRASIQLAIDQGHTAALVTAAHDLKGSSTTIGAIRLAEICKQLERDARAGSIEGAGERLVELRRELDRVSAFSRRHAARATRSG